MGFRHAFLARLSMAVIRQTLLQRTPLPLLLFIAVLYTLLLLLLRELVLMLLPRLLLVSLMFLPGLVLILLILLPGLVQVLVLVTWLSGVTVTQRPLKMLCTGIISDISSALLLPATPLVSGNEPLTRDFALLLATPHSLPLLRANRVLLPLGLLQKPWASPPVLLFSAEHERRAVHERSMFVKAEPEPSRDLALSRGSLWVRPGSAPASGCGFAEG